MSEPYPAGPEAPTARSSGVGGLLHSDLAGAAGLLAAAAVALAWANSPWQHGYQDVWGTGRHVDVAGFALDTDLRAVVNQGLMAVFFLGIGLELKRELAVGALRGWRRAALPAVAALGGMVVPVAVFVALNRPGSAGGRGWAVPMATDIAFALGVVALLGRRVPPGLRLFLLALATVDDVGAIAVIAVFYAGTVSWAALAVAAFVVVALIALLKTGAAGLPLFAVGGVALWVAVLQSGVHATIAGVVLGLLVPTAAGPTGAAPIRARPRTCPSRRRPGAAWLTQFGRGCLEAERLERAVGPVAAFAVLPVFALANAGVSVSADAWRAPGTAAVVIGVAAGLVLGKLAGISLFGWAAVRLRLSPLPDGMGRRHLVGAAAVAGVGFTVSLFTAGLAFGGRPAEAAAKLGILVGSLAAVALGICVLGPAPRR